MQVGIGSILVWRHGAALATAEVAAHAAAAAAVAAGDDAAEYRQGLTPAAGQYQIGVDIFLPKLLSCVDAHGSIAVVDASLGAVCQDGVGTVDLLELFSTFRTITRLVWMVLQCKLPV